MCPASSTSPPCVRPSPASAATPRPGQPARARRAGHRPLRADRRRRPRRRLRAQRRDRVPAQPRALPVPALGPDGVRRLQGRPAGHRHRAPGQHRVPGPHGHGPRRQGAYPDTCVGTDSHTTMVNGLGVLGWGVGGIEAEAAMLGQPVSMLIPRVVGFKLERRHPAGVTATDVVLDDHADAASARRRRQVRRVLRRGRGAGAAGEPRHHRQHERRSSARRRRSSRSTTVTLDYLRLTGRSEAQVALVEAYAKEQGMWLDPHAEGYAEPLFSEYLELDLSTVVPSIAGPKRPQDRIELIARQVRVPARPAHLRARGQRRRRRGREGVLPGIRLAGRSPTARKRPTRSPLPRATSTSCSTAPSRSRRSRPAPTPRTRGHDRRGGCWRRTPSTRACVCKPWVKTSMAPGSQVVTNYYDKAGLWPYLEKLGFHLVGYGCATCIGNSGPLAEEVSEVVNEHDLAVVSVLSGNRNFEGRINPDVKMNYLASPPLVIAYALAGTMEFDFEHEPLGRERGRHAGVPARHLADARRRSRRRSTSSIDREMFTTDYADVFTGDERWRRAGHPRGRDVRVGQRVDLRAQAPVLRGHDAWTPRRSPTSAAPACSPSSATRSPPTTSRPAGSIKPDRPAGSTSPSTAWPARLQLLRLAPRQPRGDDPRHVREHPPAQPAARTSVEGGFTKNLLTGEQDHDLRRRAGLRRGGHPAGGPRRQGVRLRLIA